MPRGARITERDRELLEFAAVHRLLLPAHVQGLWRISSATAYARLRALCSAGLLERERRFHLQPSCYLITRKGLRLIGSGLRAPRVDLDCYAHDVGVAWLWLAARGGTFGSMHEVSSERQLRSHDAAPDRSELPLSVRLGGYGAGGRERLHYPDLLLVDPDGRRIAVELELSAKGRSRRERILAGYAADGRVDAVLYLVEDRAIGRPLSASARKLGIADRVHVQLVRWDHGSPDAGASRGRVAARATRAPAGLEAGA